jgi:hypothetical protein
MVFRLDEAVVLPLNSNIHESFIHVVPPPAPVVDGNGSVDSFESVSSGGRTGSRVFRDRTST